MAEVGANIFLIWPWWVWVWVAVIAFLVFLFCRFVLCI